MSILYFSLYNAALGGMIAGVQSGRLENAGLAGAPTVPADFAEIVTAAELFALEVDAVLQATGDLPTNITGLVSAGATVVPASAAAQNGAETVPNALVAICVAAWEGRSLPTDPVTGAPFSQADYTEIATNAAYSLVNYATGAVIPT